MPDTAYTHDIDTMTPVERREYIIGLEVKRDYAQTALDDALREITSLRAEIAGRMEIEAEREKCSDVAVKLLSNMGIKEPCDAYHIQSGKGVCWGTKESEMCACGGDKTRCTHYPYTGTGAFEAGK